LELIEVYDGNTKVFLGHPVISHSKLSESKADAIIVCLYDKNSPMSSQYLPENISKSDNMYWVFEGVKKGFNAPSELNKNAALTDAKEYGIDLSLIELNLAKTPEDRIRDIGIASRGIFELKNAVSEAYAK
jgi:hypothetical protein